MTTLTQSAKSFTGGPNALKLVSSFTAKTMGHIRHPLHKKCNVIIPTWRRLTNVWYGSFTGSETLLIYIFSSLTVWRQSIDRQ